MGGSQQPQTTTQIQRVELPAWVDNASQGNYAFAEQVAGRPYQAYGGQLTANPSAAEDWANNNLNNTDARTNSALAQAQSMLGGVSYNPGTLSYGAVPLAAGAADIAHYGYVPDVNATRFNASDLTGYLNPYTQNVVDTTMGGMRDNLALSAQRSEDAAKGAGAWGSSRSGVQAAVLQSQGAKDMASTEAGLRSAAYTDAAGRLMSDNASALQAAMANQNSRLTTDGYNVGIDKANQQSALTTQDLNARIGMSNSSGALQAAMGNESNKFNAAQLGLSAANTQLGIGNAYQSSGAQNSALAMALGQNSRSIDQAGLDAARSQWQDAWDYPTQQLNTRLAALGMSPYGKTTTSTGQTSGGTSTSPLSGILGGAMSILPMLFSDRDTKKNIRKLGPTGAPGLNAYEYEYKDKMGGPKGQKHVGVMADEVKKTVPSALARAKAADGKTYDAVDYGKVGRHIAKKRSSMPKAA